MEEEYFQKYEERRKVRERASSLRLLFVYPCFRARKHRFRLLACSLSKPCSSFSFVPTPFLSLPKENRRVEHARTKKRMHVRVRMVIERKARRSSISARCRKSRRNLADRFIRRGNKGCDEPTNQPTRPDPLSRKLRTIGPL